MLTGVAVARAAAAAGILTALSVLAAGPAQAQAAPAGPARTRPVRMAPAARVRPAQGEGAQVRAAEQVQLAAVHAAAAWRISRGRGVTVGVLDTGVDTSVPDLTGSVTTGPDYTRGANPPGYQPPLLHGTFIASIIAAHGSGPGQADGVMGIAPAARVLSVRVILDDQEPGIGTYNDNPKFASAINRGIRYATDHGARVINMSLGSSEPSRQMQSAIAYAVSRGVVVVASAGNSGAPGQAYTPYSYPASFAGVVSVGAATAGGANAAFSDRNSSVVVCAPGVDVVGSGPGGSYLQASGTSPAAAFVAGVAALIRSAYPRLSPAQVDQALVASAQHRPAAGYSPATGFGEVDAVAALRAARRLAAVPAVAGLAASRSFGAGPPGPVQVAHRDELQIAVLGGVGAAGALGFLVALILLIVMVRRGPRPPQPSGMV